MKKFLLLLAVVAFAFTGCYDDMGPEEPSVNNIQLSETFIAVPNAGGTYSVTVTSDYDWQAAFSSPNSWITLNNTSGNAGVSYLSFTVAPNSTSSERKGAITVYCEDYNLSAEIIVSQEANSSSSEVTFEFGAGTITDTTAVLAAYPSDNNVTYYWDVYDAATVAYMGTVEFMNAYHQMLQEMLTENNASWNAILSQGQDSLTYEGLTPATEYVIFAFVVDAATGTILSKDLSYTVFKTAESTATTVDPSWFGSWELTSESTYMQTTNASGEYEEAFLDQTLTRTITIEDSGNGDGTVVVYGWDGNFLDGAPALALVEGETLRLINDVVVYEDTEQGLVYQWKAQSTIPTYSKEEIFLIGGQYATYNFIKVGDSLIGQNGSGKVSPDGSEHEFYVQAFTIFPINATDETVYVWQYTEPAYTFAGEAFNAKRVVATRSLTSKKLVSKKNSKFRMMHKYANAKVAAQEFSSAVRFAGSVK